MKHINRKHQEELNKLSTSNYRYKESLAIRLLYLINPPEDEVDDEWPDVNVFSLKELVRFLVVLQPQKPSLLLCDDGNIRAEWGYEVKETFRETFVAIRFDKPIGVFVDE